MPVIATAMAVPFASASAPTATCPDITDATKWVSQPVGDFVSPDAGGKYLQWLDSEIVVTKDNASTTEKAGFSSWITFPVTPGKTYEFEFSFKMGFGPKTPEELAAGAFSAKLNGQEIASVASRSLTPGEWTMQKHSWTAPAGMSSATFRYDLSLDPTSAGKKWNDDLYASAPTIICVD